jgi:hypothetical protein
MKEKGGKCETKRKGERTMKKDERERVISKRVK